MIESVSLKTSKRLQLIDVTSMIDSALKEFYGDYNGALLCYVPHTTAAITINEAADHDVALDIESFLKLHLPEGIKFRHLEGNSDAHVISTLIGSSVMVPVESGNLKLGRWQGIFFVEADGPRTRSINLVKLTS
ncbi:secondary thiamine-phosphate synthase enzyme [Thermodesulfobium acidiphilum]|uniref:Secondary thiamine-phosphate synthase enzyme n=1 Tax=Thermodesulfobium acidiphilum TaxID=1794699 RepID=A0A2R4VYS5_THEAF|nr:secondary thiamine-phosphate synthase enzyme YjbQ [Thermodesulfobium acidiphilum]AWB09685.1 secondary thiamine-phosphate synthase enzyme [Thermodesulfobium acidiphilum]